MLIREELTNYKNQHDSFNHISFSFDNHTQEVRQPRKTIDQYLRLKTNQSIQEKSNNVNKRSCYKKSLKSQQAETENNYHLQLKNDEQVLRIQSLTKQYQLKLAKQEEFFSLRQWKLKQEIQNLSLQIGSMNEEVRRLRTASKHQSTHCSLCSDGQVINHLTSVLRQVEENHRHCLDNKKEMARQLDSSNGKLEVLQEQHDKIYQQCKMLSKQIRNNNSQIHQLQEQKNQLKQSIVKKQNEWYNKQLSFENTIQQLTRRISQMQERREDENIANSKATLQSTNSILTNIQNLNGSFINSRPNSQKKRNSVSKILVQENEENQNPYNHRKMSDFSKSNNYFHETKRSSKAGSMMYKFF